MSSAPTTAPPDVENRSVAVWLVVTCGVTLLLAGLAAIVASNWQTWGIKSETLHIAAIHFPEEIVPLIRSGRDVNELMGGRTPLEQAVTFGKVESVRMLLHHRADPDLYDPGGATSPAVARSGVIHHGDPPDGPPLGSGHLNLRNPEDRTIVLLLLDAGPTQTHRGRLARLCCTRQRASSFTAWPSGFSIWAPTSMPKMTGARHHCTRP